MQKLTLTILIAILFASMTARGQWNQSPFVPNYVYEVDFPAANAAYITGYNSVYKSTDGGISWNEIYNAGPFANLTDLNFINADTGFVNLYGTVYRTFDGGTSWTKISGNGGQPIKIIGEKLFASYVSNDTTYMVKSDDYGTNWTTIFQQYELSALPYLFSFIDSLNARLINPNELGKVYKTNDGCVSFDTLIITIGNIVLQEKYDFKDLHNGYLYGSRGRQSHPTRTWITRTYYIPIDLDGFGVLPVLDLDFNTSKLYASSLYGKIFYSQDYGGSWTEQITPITDPIYSISFLNDNQGIAVGGNKILYTNNGGITGIQLTTDLTSSIIVYPNPFSTQTVLQTDKILKNATLTVDNCFGQTVKEIKNISGQTVTLFRGNLPSGLYFIRLTQDSKVIATDKVVIVDK